MKTSTFIFFLLFLFSLFFLESLLLKVILLIIVWSLYLMAKKSSSIFIEGEMIRIRSVPYCMNLMTPGDCFNSEKIFINEYFLDVKVNEKVKIIKIDYDLMKKLKLEKNKTDNIFIVTILCKRGNQNELIAI